LPVFPTNATLHIDDAPVPFALGPSVHARKRLAQAKNWQQVVATLVWPYLQLIRETENLRLKSRSNTSEMECTCGQKWRRLSVVVVRMFVLERIQIITCNCRPAPLQLLRRGLFGCAPINPSLAVELQVLSLVTGLFLRLSPNNTAVSDTLVDFLKDRGYVMKGEDPLRKRFSNALHWYNVLQDRASYFLDQMIEVGREEILREDNEEPEPPAEDSRQNEEDRLPGEGSVPLLRPSEYLRARCPICFGGKVSASSQLNAFACIDAVFTQKNNKHATRDPPREHPKSVFIPESEVRLWEDFVAEVRPPKAKKDENAQSAKDDFCEGPLRVPNSVLNACENSFTAADGTRQKASTQFFDSTGLMGMLCRHDRVLWLVNMTSPGEHQHYVFTLIERLSNHLPPWFTVGLLYDVACSTHRSCVKWDFLSPFLSRITFAISVFHAYGHAWPCQCIYHPRKCKGFGLTDGEGCERFWHSICMLVAYLRVCGVSFRSNYTSDIAQLCSIHIVALSKIIHLGSPDSSCR